MQPNSINLFQDGNEWVVVMIEDGNETRRSFSVEMHAVNWSDGQRKRLGLEMAAVIPLEYDES